jgi:hypothetical protein
MNSDMASMGSRVNLRGALRRDAHLVVISASHVTQRTFWTPACAGVTKEWCAANDSVAPANLVVIMH